MSTAKTLEPAFLALIAEAVNARVDQIASASALLEEGATVPFIARYRKEATGGLEDEQLEVIAKKRTYFLELADRRDSILESIAEQGKLTETLEKAIRAATGKQELEDLYLPYKRKRRTKAQIARERGLEPLADALLAGAAQGDQPDQLAAGFVDPEKEVPDTDKALEGARMILAERLAENADNRAGLRRVMANESMLQVRVLTGKEEEGQVYRDYFDYCELAKNQPSHRLLAILRGEREGFLISDLEIDDDMQVQRLAHTWDCDLQSACGAQIKEATADGYKRLLRPSLTNEIRGELREKAEAEAISVFRDNLEALLMQSPLGLLSVMGLDPAYRTGCKMATVDETGRVVATGVLYPIEPNARPAQAAKIILDLVKEHKVRAIAVGNGTGSRETEIFTRKVIKEAGLNHVIVAIVPETGASVYSASALAREELPDLDVSIRGAVSIARRLQDPLAELVKIEPKSLGVGQYQHDVNQKALAAELDLAVENVVNRVGVELNSASFALLRRVSGLSERLAKAVVAHRESIGTFSTRKELLKVKGFGPKTFELSAGFLRVRDGKHPLDATAVHPERYKLVESMAKELGVSVTDLVGTPTLVDKLDFQNFVDEDKGIGTFTLEDIRKELKQPGRDPRPEYKAPAWRDDVQSVEDLQEGMILEGRVSNVTNFGAFVDIGVKRDGLVHLSELSNQWVDDPRTVVKAGQVVKVKVVEVDKKRGRIGLSMKALQEGGVERGPQRDTRRQGGGRGQDAPRRSSGDRGGQRRHQDNRRHQGGGQRRSSSGGDSRVTLGDLMGKFNRK